LIVTDGVSTVLTCAPAAAPTNATPAYTATRTHDFDALLKCKSSAQPS
jgi:hypothetical protein